MTELLTLRKTRFSLDAAASVAMPSFGAGNDSAIIDRRLKAMKTLISGATANLSSVRNIEVKDLAREVQLQRKLASLKQMVASISMHLDDAWRTSLLSRLGRLLDPENWDEEFQLPSEQSFSTFLRMIVYLHPTRRPGIGLSAAGHLLAAWTRDSDRIVIECAADDEVRWVLSRLVDGTRESGAGKVQIHRIPDVTAPYDPEKLFNNGDKLLA
jgi:hypothetical protein